jgi:hypothetical protein
MIVLYQLLQIFICQCNNYIIKYGLLCWYHTRVLYVLLFKLISSCFSAVISDDEHGESNQHNPIEHEDMPHGSCRTPPTPPARSPPPTSPLSFKLRVRAVARHGLRPVSIPNIVCDMAGNLKYPNMCDAPFCLIITVFKKIIIWNRDL